MELFQRCLHLFTATIFQKEKVRKRCSSSHRPQNATSLHITNQSYRIQPRGPSNQPAFQSFLPPTPDSTSPTHLSSNCAGIPPLSPVVQLLRSINRHLHNTSPAEKKAHVAFTSIPTTKFPTQEQLPSHRRPIRAADQLVLRVLGWV